MSNNRKWGWIVVVGLVVLALIIIPLASSAFKSSPEGWLRDNYEHVSGEDPDDAGGVVFHSDDDAAQTAGDVDAGTDADDVREEDGTHYLRYDSDWLVTVADDTAGGSAITLYDFDTGYRAHSGVLFFWGSFYNRGGGGSSYRGGGSGSGK